MNFDEIQKKAKEEWEALEKGDKSHIIIGTATCGRAAGAMAVNEAINSELAKHNIEIPYPQRDLHLRSGVPWEQLGVNSQDETVEPDVTESLA